MQNNPVVKSTKLLIEAQECCPKQHQIGNRSSYAFLKMDALITVEEIRALRLRQLKVWIRIYCP